MINTFALRDHNLAGPVVWAEETTPEAMAEYVNSRAGMWFDPSGQGAILLTDEWSLEVWLGREAEGTEPDLTFTHFDVAPLADLAGEVVSDHDLLLRELMELVDETPGSLRAKVRAIMVEHITVFQA